MLLGYARVSTQEQDLNSQIHKLNEIGCKKIFTDKISGAKFKRNGLTDLFNVAREGDTIVVLKLDRLGRSLKDIIELFNKFNDLGLKFKSITENIDTTTPAGKLLFHLTASFGEFERDIIRQRTRIGLEAARAKGKWGGRPKKTTIETIAQAKALHDSKQYNTKEILEKLGCGRATYYKMLHM